jgi:hypothetical protein
VWTAGALWAASGHGVLRLDASTLRVGASHAVKGVCDDTQVTGGFGAVWVVSGDCSRPGRLTKIDPGSGRAVWSVRIPGFAMAVAPWAIAHCLVVATVAGRARWVVVKVDPVARESGVLKGPLAGASAPGAGSDGLTQIGVPPAGLWAAPSGSGGVVRVTPRSPAGLRTCLLRQPAEVWAGGR